MKDKMKITGVTGRCKVKYFYEMGFSGVFYYITINDLRIDICSSDSDEEAKRKTLFLLDFLNISYKEEDINFKHDGTW